MPLAVTRQSMADFFRLTSGVHRQYLPTKGSNGPRVQGDSVVSQTGSICFELGFQVCLRSEKVTKAATAVKVELKRCPRCEESLPLSEFGVCRARKDGLNLYCKRCIRQKIALSRQALREYKNARSKHGGSTASGRPRLTIEAKLGFS